MNRIAIVGHPSSGYRDVEALLQQYGLVEAAPSRREGMSVHEIQASLCKAHNAIAIEQAQQEEELVQLMPSDVWQGLALDFLLGNMEQQAVWGWASPNTLPLLNMWHEVDEQTQFVLVYQHPVVALEQALAIESSTTPEELLNNWAAYHGALLSFYLRHPNRCLLVHAQQMLNEPEITLKHLSGLTHADQQNQVVPIRGSSPLVKALQKLAIGSTEQYEKLEAAPLSAYLHQQVVEQHSALALYDELQASATQPASPGEPVDLHGAWQCLLAQKTTLLNYVGQLQSLKSELESAANKQKTSAPSVEELQQENSMLLEQLQLVQEELEKFYQSGEGVRFSEQTTGPYYGADERVKRQLTYRLGAVVVKSNSVKDFFLLPIALKREHTAYKKDLKTRKSEKLPPVAQYADAHKAEQVKRHLSYRLGEVILKNASSPLGWVKIPFALNSETRAFRQERKH
ncbi:hypothetical protein [Vreelandella sp. H-I2]